MTLTVMQIVGLFVLAIPIACIARTVVYEEIFREPREYCQARSRDCGRLMQRKFFYLFTCEYCFSHYVALAALLLTGYRLMYDGWRGFGIAFFSLVFVANFYLALYARLRIDITSEKRVVDVREKQIEKIEQELKGSRDDGVSADQTADRLVPPRPITK